MWHLILKNLESPYFVEYIIFWANLFPSLNVEEKNFCVSAKMFTLIKLSVFVISEKNFFMDSPRKWFFRKKGTFGAFYKWVYCLNAIKICYFWSVVFFNVVPVSAHNKKIQNLIILKKVTTSSKNPFFSCATIFIKLTGNW